MSFKDTEFNIKGVRFQIEKLKALDGFRTLEKVRKAIASSGLANSLDLDQLKDGQDNAKLMASLMGQLLEIDEVLVEQIRISLFKGVSYRGNGVEKGWMKLEDFNIDMAFEGLPTTAIYEVLIRALAVNFMDCLDGFGSLSKLATKK